VSVVGADTLGAFGREATLRTFTFSGSYDDYGDPEFTETSETVLVYTEPRGEARSLTSAYGDSIEVDIKGFVDVSKLSPLDSSPDDPVRPPEMTLPDGGEIVIHYVRHPGNGLAYFEARRRE
jgi:hypothetical protein